MPLETRLTAGRKEKNKQNKKHLLTSNPLIIKIAVEMKYFDQSLILPTQTAPPISKKREKLL